MLIAYFGIVFTLSWLLWFAADAVSATALSIAAVYLGVFTPGIVALAFRSREHGAAGVRRLLSRLVQWDVGARWFAFALLFVFSIKLLVAVIVRIGTGAWPVFGS